MCVVEADLPAVMHSGLAVNRCELPVGVTRGVRRDRNRIDSFVDRQLDLILLFVEVEQREG